MPGRWSSRRARTSTATPKWPSPAAIPPALAHRPRPPHPPQPVPRRQPPPAPDVHWDFAPEWRWPPWLQCGQIPRTGAQQQMIVSEGMELVIMFFVIVLNLLILVWLQKWSGLT